VCSFSLCSFSSLTACFQAPDETHKGERQATAATASAAIAAAADDSDYDVDELLARPASPRKSDKRKTSAARSSSTSGLSDKAVKNPDRERNQHDETALAGAAVSGGAPADGQDRDQDRDRLDGNADMQPAAEPNAKPSKHKHKRKRSSKRDYGTVKSCRPKCRRKSRPESAKATSKKKPAFCCKLPPWMSGAKRAQ
jgi:hypothetical protein